MQEQGVGLDGSHIWAAQYRRLDIRYIKPQSETTTSLLPATFSLFPDVLSQGVLRADDSETNMAVVQSLEDGNSVGEAENANVDEDPADDENEYYREVIKAVSEMDGYYPEIQHGNVEADKPGSDEE